jgi:hypothetical protein
MRQMIDRIILDAQLLGAARMRIAAIYVDRQTFEKLLASPAVMQIEKMKAEVFCELGVMQVEGLSVKEPHLSYRLERR